MGREGREMSTSFTATAIWLRRISETHCEVLVEIDGKWHKAITEVIDSPFSHIAEGNGKNDWPIWGEK